MGRVPPSKVAVAVRVAVAVVADGALVVMMICMRESEAMAGEELASEEAHSDAVKLTTRRTAERRARRRIKVQVA